MCQRLLSAGKRLLAKWTAERCAWQVSPLKEGIIRSVLALVVASFARMVARLTALLATVMCFSEVEVDHHDRPW